MINLLPPEHKRDIRAARANSLLIKYNFLLVGVFLFLLLSIGVVYVYLNNTKATAEATMQENDSKVSNFAMTREEAEQFRQNLSTAKQILDREVNYTKVILKIAGVLPQGTVLTGLSLDAATFGKETTLSAQAKSYDLAIKLKDALGQSGLFTDVHFQSIAASTNSSDYPITVNLMVTFDTKAAKV